MQKKIFIFILFILSISAMLSLLACGNLFHDMPDVSEDQIPIDPVIPKIIYTYPPDKGTGIELDKAILASFNKEMNISTINDKSFIVKKIETITTNNQTTTIETILEGQISIHNNNTILFRLKNAKKMDPLSSFSVLVSKEIKDSENLNLADDYIWSFDTSDKEDNIGPEVISTEPLSFIYTTENIVTKAVFNEDLDPFTVSGSTCILRKFNSNNSTTFVPGIVSYEAGTKTVLYVPANPLEVSASYEVLIISGQSGIKDLSENPMANDCDWNFRHLITYSVPCDIPGLNMDCCE